MGKIQIYIFSEELPTRVRLKARSDLDIVGTIKHAKEVSQEELATK